MDEKRLRKALSDIPLGDIRFYRQVGSTNDIALAWATEGAKDFSLVIADEQTSGRGRMGRRWLTPPGSALAMSLILQPTPLEREHVSLLSGLGALALTQLLKEYGLLAQIKWPNDILIARRKTAGILAETVWLGDQVETAVIGIGVNVLPESIPPATEVPFPATSIHTEGVKIDRLELLHDLLARLVALRPQVGTQDFVRAWEAALAFKDETVQVWAEPDSGALAESPLTGVVRGLESDGALRLETPSGIQFIQFGEIHLRPL
jgi:BirA family transcriptional regulator, biotin operon repressor / biotin---[acetyl-CoA-carboxylase] ligase